MHAERTFDARPTFLIVGAAITVLVAYGAVWFSVRDQHPYSGPSGTALAVLYGTLAAWAVLNFVVDGRALVAAPAARGHHLRDDLDLAVAAVALGSFAAFAGPAAVWGVIAVGPCALLLQRTDLPHQRRHHPRRARRARELHRRAA
ncbi:MAG TPA: hypothetical protein VE220_01260, partial [Gaiellaceae bacterium]|nr:hypothetical protein [Gaiellaceae bacterium]